jgi:outer membrane biosynthesis protein TonB
MGSAVPQSPPSVGSQPPQLSATWSALLEAFTRHDERGKAAVQSAAGHVRDSPERRLARTLLDEWGPPVQRERLEQPEIVLLPGVAPSARIITMEIFDLNVRVGPDGRVLTAEFVTPPQQPELSREVLAKVRAALFRPSFRDGRFVESQAVVQYTVHVK